MEIVSETNNDRTVLCTFFNAILTIHEVYGADSDDDIIDTLLPEELRGTELDAKFDDLQARYEALFINNKKEFTYKGFSSPKEKAKFLSDWQTAYNELEAAVNGRYSMTNEIRLTFPEGNDQA